MYQSSRLEGKKVLITGGLGFIGSNLAHALVAAKSRVTLLDACLEPYGWNMANVSEIHDRISWIRGDIRDRGTLRAVVAGTDAVIDCAAQVSHTISVRNPMLDAEINCCGALNVLEAVRREAPGARVIYCSTRGVIGRMRSTPIDESHPMEPVDFNGVHKMSAEYYHRLYHRIHGTRTTVLRVNNTYGPRSQMRSDDYGIVNWLLRCAMQNEEIIIHGDGSQTRDYNYIDDVVNAFLMALDSPRAVGETYALGSGNQTSLAEVLALILRLTGSSSRVAKISRPQERQKIEIGNYLVSIKKIKDHLGWQPEFDLESGLARTIDFYRPRLSEYV